MEETKVKADLLKSIQPKAVIVNQKEQIDELNSQVKLTLAPSSIDGVGVFALRDIQKGEKLYLGVKETAKWYNVPYSSFNKLFPEVKAEILKRWPSVVNGSVFFSPNDVVMMVTFLNHSDDPNVDVTNDVALREIKKGEELTEYYREMANHEKVYPWLNESTKETAMSVNSRSTWLKGRFKSFLP